MDYLMGMGLGAILAALGLLTAVWAPRVGPNPFFGVRTGYSYASRAVWDRANRVGGFVLSAVGALVVGLAALLWGLGVPPATGQTWLLGAMLAAVLSMAVWSVVYTRRLALSSSAAAQYAPVDAPLRVVAPALLSWALVAGVALLLYPTLPDTLATHFNTVGEPDGWTSRGAFIPLYLALTSLGALIPLGVALIARSEPVIGLVRLGRRTIQPRDGIAATAWAMTLMNLFFLAVLWDIAWFSWYGQHIAPVGPYIVGLIVGLIGGTLAIFYHFSREP